MQLAINSLSKCISLYYLGGWRPKWNQAIRAIFVRNMNFLGGTKSLNNEALAKELAGDFKQMLGFDMEPVWFSEGIPAFMSKIVECMAGGEAANTLITRVRKAIENGSVTAHWAIDIIPPDSNPKGVDIPKPVYIQPVCDEVSITINSDLMTQYQGVEPVNYVNIGETQVKEMQGKVEKAFNALQAKFDGKELGVNIDLSHYYSLLNSSGKKLTEVSKRKVIALLGLFKEHCQLEPNVMRLGSTFQTFRVLSSRQLGVFENPLKTLSKISGQLCKHVSKEQIDMKQVEFTLGEYA